MRIYAYRFKAHEWFGDFIVISSFKIFLDFHPFKFGNTRWQCKIIINGSEVSQGRTLAHALSNMYALIRRNYYDSPSSYRDYLQDEDFRYRRRYHSY